MKKTLFTLFVCTFFYLHSQTNTNQKVVDSVISVSNTKENDSLAIDYLHKSFFKYSYSQPEVSLQLIEAALEKSQSINNSYLVVRSFLRRGIYYDITSKQDSALIDYDRAYKIATQGDDKPGVAAVLNNKGLIYWNREEFKEAMQNYLQSLKIYEELDIKRGQANNLNNIGLLLVELDRLEESNEYYKRSLKLRKEIDDKYGIGASYSNLSKNLTLMKKVDSGIYYNHKAIKIKKEINDLRGLGITYNHLGGQYKSLAKSDSAIFYLKKADDVYISLKSRRLRATNVKSLGQLYYDLGQYHNAINSYNTALEYFGDSELKSKQKTLLSLANSYQNINSYKKASQYYQKALILKDSLVEENNKIEMQEIFEKYESAEKEKKILTQRADLAEQNLDISKKNNYILILVALAMLLSLLGYLFYNQQRLKNRQLQKENELKDALVKIETQNRLQNQRLRISRDLHDNIGAQLTFIISSLDNLKYGFKIPEKLSDKLKNISQFTSTTIYELRDTIWAMNKNEITLEDLQIRISNFIEKAKMASEKNQFNFNVDDNLSKEKIFTSLEGMNIYRIIQEAVNNAIKYAEADKIDIDFTLKDAKALIKISDNGKGFDENTIAFGNGLNNMKKRANELGAGFKIESNKDKGTQVSIKL